MHSRFVSGALSALVYCQALLMVAALASVLMRGGDDDGGRHAPLTVSAVAVERI